MWHVRTLTPTPLPKGEGLEAAGHPVDQREKPLRRIFRAAGQFAAAAQFGQRRFPHRAVVESGPSAQHVQRAIADAARWGVHRALEGGVIVAIGGEAQIGQRILDFGTFEEALAAVDAVTDPMLDQLFLEVA